jgi:bacterioferritin-associated ferredoxin
MYVCVCLAVTEAEVGEVIESGAHTREAVTQACRAGGDCGACHGMIENMIEDHVEATQPRAPSVSGCPAAAPSGDRLVPTAALTRGRAA